MLQIRNKKEVIFVSDTLYGTLAERVRDLRRADNLTMEQLADKIGINKSTISRIENGDPVMSDIALAISNHFGVSMDYLFGLSDDRTTVNYDLKSLGISPAVAEKFRNIDFDSLKGRESLINHFVKSVIVNDDKIIVTLNYNNKEGIFSFDEIEGTESSSDITLMTQPTKKHPQKRVLFCWFALTAFCCEATESHITERSE